jgi:ribosomal protein S18 acetylase RimI-like enzyme
MPTLQFSQPASVAEAHALLAATAMPVDSLTQRRIRSDQNLSDYFEAGRRRPEWVWVARYDDAHDAAPLGVVGAFGTPDGRLILDLFGVPADPTVARALMARATDSATPKPEETVVFAPPGTSIDDPVIAPLISAARAAGWRLLVERRHYEFEAPSGLGGDWPTTLTFEQLSDPKDPRLAACHREVMRATLDAHDRDLVERVGFDAACAEGLEYLVTADPVDRIHLAFDVGGDVVGMVSGEVLPRRERGVVLFVGVAHGHRGRGYGRQLLAWQTRRLLAEGATTLIADTDNDNVPMAAAFADVGWPQTETRIDLVPGD